MESYGAVKNLPANAGDPGSIPGSGRSPGGEHGNLLQYSCLENPMDRGDWRATVHGVSKIWTRLTWLSLHAWRVTVLILCTLLGWVRGYKRARKVVKDEGQSMGDHKRWGQKQRVTQRVALLSLANTFWLWGQPPASSTQQCCCLGREKLVKLVSL